MIKVLLVIEQPILRRGLRALFAEECDMHMCGEETDYERVGAIVREERPEVVLLDGSLTCNLPQYGAVELANMIHSVSAYRTGVVAVVPKTARGGIDEEAFFRLIRGGVAAVLPAETDETKLLETLRLVAGGIYQLSEASLCRPERKGDMGMVPEDPTGVADSRNPRASCKDCALSEREIEILRHVSCGKSNKEIAGSLKISDQTVKNHLISVLKKLRVNDRTAAVVLALQQGIIGLYDVSPDVRPERGPAPWGKPIRTTLIPMKGSVPQDEERLAAAR